MSAGDVSPREHLDVATWSDVSSRDALDLIVSSVAEMVGFEVAMVSVVRDDTLFSVAVEGDEDVRRQMLGLATPLHLITDEFDRAVDWGRFKYVPKPPAGELDKWTWIPEVDTVDGDDAWDPHDLVVAPLHAADGELIGLLSIDVPHSRRLPDERQRALMQRYAAQAERLLQIAVERDGLAERVRLAEAARTVVRFATTEDELEGALDECREALLIGFRADDVSVRTYGDDDFPDGGTTLRMFTEEQSRVVRALATRCWAEQRVAVISAELADTLSPEDHAVVLQIMTALEQGLVMLAPLGAGKTCLGHLVLIRKDPTVLFTPEEEEGAIDIARDLGSAVLAGRNQVREQRVLAELRRLASYKTQLLSTVSHELKNPLTVIRGHLEMLDGEDAAAGVAEVSVTAMDRAATRMSRLVDNLLVLAKVEDPHRLDEDQPHALRPVLQDALDQNRDAAAWNELTMTLDAPDEPLLVAAAPDDLDLLAVNLVSNAVKYTHRGGRVTVGAAARGGEVVITVRDDGIGISHDDQEKLFTEFFRSTNPEATLHPGTGLGLAICARVVARYGGRIEVDSGLGQGSTFRVYLPRHC